MNNIDVEETNRRVEIYKQVNKHQIAKNKARLDEENRKRRQKEEEERQQLLNPQAKPTPVTNPTGIYPITGQMPLRQPAPKNVKIETKPEQKQPETHEMLVKRAQAGGYKLDYPLVRANEEAFSSVFLMS